MHDNYPRRQIFLAGQIIMCESTEDLALLKEAQTLEIDPLSVLNLSVGRLHLIDAACQKYSLGKYQRLASQALDRFGI